MLGRAYGIDPAGAKRRVVRPTDLSAGWAVAVRESGKIMLFGWWKTGLDMVLLGLEAQGVIVQRMTMFASGGPAAQIEAQRMVTEKFFAVGETALMVASGASNGRVIRNYRRKVRANALRLSRG